MNLQPYVCKNDGGCPVCNAELAAGQSEFIRGDMRALSSRLNAQTRTALQMRNLNSDGRTVDGPPSLSEQIREHRRGNRPDQTYAGYERSIPQASDLPELTEGLTTTQPPDLAARIRERKR